MKNYKGYDYMAFEWYADGDIIHMFNGYVRLPKEHPLYKKVSKKKSWALGGRKHFHRDYDAVDNIDVHGGFTFAELVKTTDQKEYKQKFTPGLWLGWDYGHMGDCFYNHDNPRVKELGLGLCEKGFNEKHWTIEEVEQECKDVIDQLIKNDNS